MTRIDVYDPPMCCSTGVCGPVVDPALPRFAGDLAWLGQHGVEVARFNLAQQAGAFALKPIVMEILNGHGPDALPVVLVDGALASQGRYPSRDELAGWTGLAHAAPDSAKGAETARPSIALPTASCCAPAGRSDGSGGSGCCG